MFLQVDDFITDPQDAAPGIREALARAAAQGAEGICFSAGVYLCRSKITFATLAAAHDEGCGEQTEKDCFLHLEGLHNFVLRGAKGADGAPATVLAGYNTGEPQTLQPTMLWAEYCDGLSVQDLAFTRMPETAGAGIVVAAGQDGIRVRPVDGKHYDRPAGAYCMNRYDVDRRALLGSSLTYGFGYDLRWQPQPDGTLLLPDAELAAQTSVGEGLSWHQAGKTDFLLYFGHCRDLQLENIAIPDTNAFGILTECCRKITARRVCIAPGPSQFFAGPRDGWKIARCSGDILVEECRFEGVRMDGQNVHSNYFVVVASPDPYTLLCECRYAPHPLETGSEILFTDRRDPAFVRQAELVDWSLETTRMELPSDSHAAGAAPAVGRANRVNTYRLRLDKPLAGQLAAGTLAQALCWEPEHYTCRRSVFRNIAGAGHLLRCRHVLLEENCYQNLMNAGVLLGDELDTHTECGHAQDVQILGNQFENIGTKPRYGPYGCACIAVKSQGMTGWFNRDIRIEENRFSTSRCAVELHDVENVTLRNNQYHAIEIPLYADPHTTRNIVCGGKDCYGPQRKLAQQPCEDL